MRRVFEPTLPVPIPFLCPSCRMRRRLAFRNERNLYRRTCALTGAPIISVYRPSSDVVVYDQSVWWSDQYDPFDYGRDVDFSRPFFEQLAELHRVVPKLSIHNAKSENCEYTNYSAENRNCYLVVGGLGAEDCYFSYRVFYSKNIVDSFAISRSELCYECVQGADLYECIFCTNCENSTALFLCEDCTGCRDCFGCIGLRQKQYSVFNEPVGAERYPQLVAELRADLGRARERFAALREAHPQRALYAVRCEDSSGDQIRNCRRCQDVYFVYDSEDVIHARNGENNRDTVDLNFGDNCELQYQAANLEKNYRVAFAALAWYVSESFYILSCFNSRALFGCCGMKRGEYSILNKRYTPAEHSRTVERLAAHMIDTGEWGRYFPSAISPFLFSETVAAELFPLTDTECRALGFHGGTEPRPSPGDRPGEHPVCASCSRQFRVIAQEIEFCHRLSLPMPTDCPDCRHAKRMSRRRPMSVRPTQCHRCGKNTFTSASDGDVVCEECFQEAIL